MVNHPTKSRQQRNLLSGRTGSGLRVLFAGLLAGVAALLLPLDGFAGMDLRPEARLLSHARHGRYEQTLQLIAKHTFDRKMLGRALHTAVSSSPSPADERTICVEALLEKGADPTYAGAAGATALIVSTRQHDLATVELLLRHGADPAQQDVGGNSAAALARSMSGQQGALARLLADPPKIERSPEVQNIRLKMKNGVVHILFDLVGSDAACVSLEGSLDGGEHYDMKFDHSTGDIGKEIEPGKGKHIVWQAKDDYPEGLQNAEVVLDVVARRCG